MLDWLFGKKSKSRLGIDLGSASIKVVELEKREERLCLTNYALTQIKIGTALRINELKDEEVAEILKKSLVQAQIKTRRATISLPVDKTFSTVMELPFMKEKELAAAIPFEAQKYVPVPMEEVILDWSIISVKKEERSLGTFVADSVAPAAGKEAGIQVMLVAVPKDIINKITRIAKLAGLELTTLEQEAFSLVRSLIGNDKNIYLVIDLGRESTDLIVAEEGVIRLTHNLESINKEIILMEINRVVNIYQMRYNRKVGQCLLVGGRAIEKELFDFLSAKLKTPVKFGDPFARLAHNTVLDPALKELGPQMAVAVGLAMREN